MAWTFRMLNIKRIQTARKSLFYYHSGLFFWHRAKLLRTAAIWKTLRLSKVKTVVKFNISSRQVAACHMLWMFKMFFRPQFFDIWSKLLINGRILEIITWECKAGWALIVHRQVEKCLAIVHEQPFTSHTWIKKISSGPRLKSQICSPEMFVEITHQSVQFLTHKLAWSSKLRQYLQRLAFLFTFAQLLSSCCLSTEILKQFFIWIILIPLLSSCLILSSTKSSPKNLFCYQNFTFKRMSEHCRSAECFH